MPRVNENAGRQANGLPERCTKAEFARLMEVDGALVSRWAAGKRIELDDAGRVQVRPSLTKILLTTDPSRGGRGAVRGDGSGGSIDRARQLLQLEPAVPDPGDRADKLAADLAEALAQLEVERRFRQERCYTHDVEATLRCRLIDAMVEQWPALTAALQAGGDAFDRRMFRIELGVYEGLSDSEIDAEELVAFGPDQGSVYNQL